MRATDILVATPNPAALDETLRALGGYALVQIGATGYLTVDGHYVCRCLGDPEYLEFALTRQGYATVVRRLDQPV